MRMVNIGGKLKWILKNGLEAFKINVWLLLSQSKLHWASPRKQHLFFVFSMLKQEPNKHTRQGFVELLYINKVELL